MRRTVSAEVIAESGVLAAVEVEEQMEMLKQDGPQGEGTETIHRQLLQAVLEVSTQAILCVDGGGRIQLVNAGAERMFGYRREELEGASIQLLLPERLKEAHARHLAEYQMKPANRPMGKGAPLMGRRKDGSEFPADILLQYVEGADGRSVTVFVSDLTQSHSYRQLQESEQKLRASEERYRELIEQITDGVFVVEEEGGVCDANPAGCRMLGYDLEALQGKPFDEVLGPGERTSSVAWWGDLRVGETRRREWEFQRQDGSLLMGEMAARRLPDGRCVGSVRDVTERRRLEQQLVDSERRFRALVEVGSQALFQANPDWTEMWWLGGGEAPENSSATRENWLKNHIPEEDQPLVWQKIEEAIGKRQPFQMEHRVIWPDGTIGWVKSRAVPIFNESGAVAEWFGVAEDVTEPRSREEQLRMFIEHAPVGIAICDQEMRYLSANSHWVQHCGRTGELTGLSHYEVFPEAAEGWRAIYARVLKGETHYCEEERVKRADGTEQWIQWAALPRQDAKGRINGLFLLHVDLTRQKQAEARLSTSEERLRLAAEVADFGVLDCDPVKDRMNYWSPTLYRLSGLPEGMEVRTETMMNLLHPEDRERFDVACKEVLSAQRAIDQMALDFRIIRPDREERWWRIMSKAYFEGEHEQRRATRVIGAILDITERMQLRERLENALRWSDEERRAIVAAAPMAVVTYSANGTVTSWNQAAEKIFGYGAVEVIGKEDPTLTGEDAVGMQVAIERVLNGDLVTKEARRFQQDGTQIEVMLAMAPLHGNRDGVVCLLEDITARKKAELELKEVRAALQNARDDEARRIARELHDDITQRLSLLSVNLGELAAHPETGKKLVEGLRALQEKVIAISRAVREVSHKLHPAVLDDLGLENALEELCAEIAAREHFRVHFEAERVPRDVAKPVASCLYRVAQEALHNAAKYAQAHRVDVSLVKKGEELELCVIDAGDGFELEWTKTGLGLHSMRERVELVRGRFEISSVPGNGTRVLAVVPLQTAAGRSLAAIGN